MQLNKIKRVRSAALLTGPFSARAKNNPVLQKPCQKHEAEMRVEPIVFKQQLASRTSESHKQSEFRSTLRKLSSNSSKKSFVNSLGFSEYNRQSWRTIHSARSLNRLQSLKSCREKDPVKINLQQKVARIQSKHIQNSRRFQTISVRQNPEEKVKNSKKTDGNLIACKINQILRKWQKQKVHSIDVYRQKINFLSQKTLDDRIKQRNQLLNPKMKWQID